MSSVNVKMPMIKIGEIEVPPVILAPMAAVTDLPFRTVCEEYGVGLTITEFLSAHALTNNAKKAVDKLTPSLDGRIFGVQIFGREPEIMAQAAQMAVDIGAFLVDINMGCPAKRVVAGACGSALMKEPELAQTLVRAVKAQLPPNMPVTVKHRAGWDERHLNAPEFACAMVEAGAAMITVHGRTRTQGFSGKADRAIIRKVKEALPAHIPLVGNGDVVTVDDYFAMRADTGCDAVMIGRGAMGNPWLFRSIAARLVGEDDPGRPSVEERRATFHRHMDLMTANTPPKKLVHELRKAIAWYTKGLHGSSGVRNLVHEVREPDNVLERIRDIGDEYFVSLRAYENVADAVESDVDNQLHNVA